LAMTHEMRAAKADYTTALPLSSGIDTLNAKLGRANAEIHLDEPDLALADLDDLIAESPETIATYRAQTVRSLAQSSPQERKSWLARQDAGFNVSAAGVFYLRATAYRNLGQYEKSLADSDTAITLAPGYPSLYSGRARTEFAMGNWRAGFADFWTRTKLVFGWK
jgi:tetratricopeptide (TPR) repeat protein